MEERYVWQCGIVLILLDNTSPEFPLRSAHVKAFWMEYWTFVFCTKSVIITELEEPFYSIFTHFFQYSNRAPNCHLCKLYYFIYFFFETILFCPLYPLHYITLHTKKSNSLQNTKKVLSLNKIKKWNEKKDNGTHFLYDCHFVSFYNDVVAYVASYLCKCNSHTAIIIIK